MYWVRVDNRLVHGQIIEAWLPFTGAKILLVVNDDLAKDALRQEIISLAVPSGVEIVFLCIGELSRFISSNNPEDDGVFVLFSNCQDACRAHETGFGFGSINIGNLHYAPGKRQVLPHVALTQDDEQCLDYLQKSGVNLDYRCVPKDPVQLRA